MRSLILSLVIVGVILFFANGPYDSGKKTAMARQAVTSNPRTPLEIAVVWPEVDSNLFREGAALAAREINDRGGVTLTDEHERSSKVPVKLHFINEPSDPDLGRFAARLAGNTHLSAIIGHNSPDGAVSSSVAYEDHELLYISPNVSSLRLGSHGLRFFIQPIPNDKIIADTLIHFALSRGWTSAAVLYPRDSYGMTYAGLLREEMGELQAKPTADSTESTSVRLVAHESYGDTGDSYYLLISQLLEHKFDVLILPDSLVGDTGPRTLRMIKQLREMGVTQPILGTEELNLAAMLQTLGPHANNIFACAMFYYDGKRATARSRAFAAAFEARYQTRPTEQAGAAYESVMLVVQAAERARSKVPIKMATMLKSTRDWSGLQGDKSYNFDLTGSIVGKSSWVQELKDGRFHEAIATNEKVVIRQNPYSNMEGQKSGSRSAKSHGP